MAQYYLMECYGGYESCNIDSYPELPEPLDNWFGGERWQVEVPEPLHYTIRPGYGGVMIRKSMHNESVLLMSDALIAALQECGVDNLDCYDAVVTEKETGKKHHDCKAVNIVGAITAADMESSHATEIGFGFKWFDKLVLDETKANGLLLFRLAEKLSAIVVHEKVKNHVEKKIPDMEFYLPEDWPSA